MKTRGLLIDLDGTLHVGDRPIPDAVETLETLRDAEWPIRFVTNTTRLPVRGIADRMQAMGFRIETGEILTAPRAAVKWLRSQGLRRVHPLLRRETWEDLTGLELVDEGADAVLVGDLGDELSRERMDLAFRVLRSGARLIAVQKNRHSQGPDGPELDAGAFVAALEFAAETEAVVIGKPNREFFRAAAADIGLPPSTLVMVGDDVRGDVGGAQRAGARGILVRTGKFRSGDDTRLGVRCDGILDSIATLPEWLATH